MAKRIKQQTTVEQPTERKRKRINKRRRRTTPASKSAKQRTGLVICDGTKNGKCWFDGHCPHKEPHEYNERCEVSFCSLMQISCCCKAPR